MSFWDFVYSRFEWLGKLVLKIYPNLDEMIRKSDIHIYYEAYAAFVGFMTLLTTGIVGALIALVLMLHAHLLLIPLLLPIPFLVFVFLANLPALIGSSRAGGLEGEMPYTTAYLSIMVTSGISPYTAFERISRSKEVFPKSSELSQRFVLLVKVLGRDPLSAFSMLAERTPSPTVKDLLSGYITTVRAGGDVGDYLTKKARMFFSEILVKMKIIADRISGILEAYLALILLTTLSLSTMYFVNTSIAAAAVPGLSGPGMFMLLYIMMPMLSGIILYLADIMQYKEPWIDIRPYLMYFGVSFPLMIFLLFFGLVIPAVLPPYHPMRENPITVAIDAMFLAPAKAVGVDDYLYPTLVMAWSLLVATLPAAIYEIYVSREYKIVDGITRFLRDMVEIRKTGLAPERSIIELSRRSYGVFTNYLRRIAMQLSLGTPLSKIVAEVNKKIIVWRAKVLLYMLTDAVEVGGGTIDVLENLAWFAENTAAIEDERKKNLRILLLVPYVGAVLTVSAIILLAVFMGSLTFQVTAYKQAAVVTLPAIIINVYMMGFVAGKTSGGSVAAGFKHAVLLMLIAILVVYASPAMKAGFTNIAKPVGPMGETA